MTWGDVLRETLGLSAEAVLDAAAGGLSVEQTPDGVPDGAEYVPPDETPPDDATIHKGPGGATYVTRGDDNSDDVDEPDGRFGMASDPEVLSEPFDHSEDRVGAREAGIDGGATSAEQMDILEMPDGSRVFAIPTSAYVSGNVGVGVNDEEAVANNRVGPEIVEAFGGGAADTEIVEHEGEEYIVKEGVDGHTIHDINHDPGIDTQIFFDAKDAVSETVAAGYFAGNSDLHGGNIVYNHEDDEAYVIDHDVAGGQRNEWPHPGKMNHGFADSDDVIDETTRMAIEYIRGDVDVPDGRASGLAELAIDELEAEKDLWSDVWADYDSEPGVPLMSYDESPDVPNDDDEFAELLEGLSEGNDVVRIEMEDGDVVTDNIERADYSEFGSEIRLRPEGGPANSISINPEEVTGLAAGDRLEPTDLTFDYELTWYDRINKELVSGSPGDAGDAGVSSEDIVGAKPI